MSAKNLNAYMKSVKDKLVDRFTDYHNKSEKLEIGSIVTSIVPLDPDYYLPCDGRVLDYTNPNYKDLYAAIGDQYNNETSERVETGCFKIPLITDVLLRNVDTEGKYDDANRPLGDVKDWGVPEDKINNFDLKNQDVFVKNIQAYVSKDHTDDQDTVPLHIIGSSHSSNFKSRDLRFVPNGGGAPRVSDKVSFKRFTVMAYIKYRAYEI